jgi:hypothetical protein
VTILKTRFFHHIRNVRKKTRLTPKFEAFALKRIRALIDFPQHVRKKTRLTSKYEMFVLKRDKGINEFSTT